MFRREEQYKCTLLAHYKLVQLKLEIQIPKKFVN